MFVQSNTSRAIAHFRAGGYTRCLALLLTQIVLVAGCAVAPKQPFQIPAFASGDEKSGACPGIAGRYANTGEAFTDEGKTLEPASLSLLLFGPDPACAAADTVSVAEPEPDVIDFRFFEKGQPVATRRISKYTWRRATGGRGIFANWDSNKYGQPYYCANGFLDIAISESHGGAAGVGMYAAATDCRLRKGLDGSLIVLQQESGFAVCVIVPVGGSHCTWYRFPAIAGEGQPQPDLVK